MPKCSIWKDMKNKEELVQGICEDCASAILKEDEYDVGIDDFS